MEDKDLKKLRNVIEIKATTKLRLIYQMIFACIYYKQSYIQTVSTLSNVCYITVGNTITIFLHCSLWHVIIHLCRLVNDVNIIPFEPFKKLDDEIK